MHGAWLLSAPIPPIPTHAAIPYTNGVMTETIDDVNGTEFSKLSDNRHHYQWMMDRPQTKDYQWNGLINSMISLSANGDSVSASFYTYDRLGVTATIPGIRIDRYPQQYANSSQVVTPDVFFWRPYSIQTRKEDVLVQKVDKFYDDLGASMATVTDYTYTDSLRIREEKTTLLDGTSYATAYKYVDDYSVYK